jgi:hypothetical protein
MAQRINSLRDLLPEGHQGTPEAVVQMQANLRSSLHQDPDPIEAKVVSVLPGDDVESHPSYLPPNKYLKHGFLKLKRAWDTGKVPESEQSEVRRAMSLLLDGGQPFEAQPCIAKDQTEVRYYQGNLKGDEDIFDPSAFNGPKTFNATVLHSDD